MRRLFTLLLLFFLPLLSFAQDFVPLVGIPYLETSADERSLGDYVNALYIAAISIAAVLAVLRIIYAGVQYMLTDVVTQKGAAKKTIRNALIGLILIVAAFLILNTINPQLTSLNSLNQLQGLNLNLQAPTAISETADGAQAVFDSCQSPDFIEQRNIGGQGSRNNLITVCCSADGSTGHELCRNAYQRNAATAGFVVEPYSTDNRAAHEQNVAECTSKGGSVRVTTIKARVYNFNCFIPEAAETGNTLTNNNIAVDEPTATEPVRYGNKAEADEAEANCIQSGGTATNEQLGSGRGIYYQVTCTTN
jgi:hypothetical protein